MLLAVPLALRWNPGGTQQAGEQIRVALEGGEDSLSPYGRSGKSAFRRRWGVQGHDRRGNSAQGTAHRPACFPARHCRSKLRRQQPFQSHRKSHSRWMPERRPARVAQVPSHQNPCRGGTEAAAQAGEMGSQLHPAFPMKTLMLSRPGSRGKMGEFHLRSWAQDPASGGYLGQRRGRGGGRGERGGREGRGGGKGGDGGDCRQRRERRKQDQDPSWRTQAGLSVGPDGLAQALPRAGPVVGRIFPAPTPWVLPLSVQTEGKDEAPPPALPGLLLHLQNVALIGDRGRRALLAKKPASAGASTSFQTEDPQDGAQASSQGLPQESYCPQTRAADLIVNVASNYS